MTQLSVPERLPDGSQEQQQQKYPFRIRTITVFLELPSDDSQWEQEIAAAGTFLRLAQQHLERLGYEVQTTRIATQPFPQYLSGNSSSGSSSSSNRSWQRQQRQQQQQQQRQDQDLSRHIYVTNAAKLEALAAKHGIQLVSIGSSTTPEDITVIPHVITATQHVSCSFAMPDVTNSILAQKVAAAIMQIAAATDGMGNFRFAAASNIRPGIPYFPVAVAGPGMHRSFAIGTECDALLYQAFAAAAGSSSSSHGDGTDVLAAAEQQLTAVLQQHLGKLEAAALDVEAAAAAVDLCTQQQQQQQQQQRQQQQQHFRYLGIDTSIAPGLDTPSLTSSYELLSLGQFGGPGSLTVSSVITRVLKSLKLKMTGYCGLMLAVCEDEGLAAAAADGSITISQLLQYSAVCGCGLDTVPVPGPSLTNNSSSSRVQQQQQQVGLQQHAVSADAPSARLGGSSSSSDCDMQQQQRQQQQQQPTTGNADVASGIDARTAAAAAAAAAAADAENTKLIAALLCDVNTLAYRLNKPLACRLLPLPNRRAGDTTGFNHPYMVNSRVMDLRK